MEKPIQFKNIEEYYNFIDSKIFDLKETGNAVTEVRTKISELEEIDKNKILLELDCLNIRIQNGCFPEYLPENYFENFDTFYIEKRIESSKNKYLKAHFSHIMWLKYKNHKYFPIAIDSYFELVEIYKQLDIENPQENFGFEICHILGNLEYLTFSYNKRVDDFVNLLLDLIHNPNKQSHFFHKA